MKTPTLYVILDSSGRASVVTDQATEKVDLYALLDEGWRPVSETSFGAAHAILIRLEKENDGGRGFGFGGG